MSEGSGGGGGGGDQRDYDGLQDGSRLDEDEALELAREASLRTGTDAALNDKMLDSELRRAQHLSLRQSQADAARATEREEEELRLALDASMASSTPSANASQRTAAAVEEPTYRQNYG